MYPLFVPWWTESFETIHKQMLKIAHGQTSMNSKKHTLLTLWCSIEYQHFCGTCTPNILFVVLLLSPSYTWLAAYTWAFDANSHVPNIQIKWWLCSRNFAICPPSLSEDVITSYNRLFMMGFNEGTALHFVRQKTHFNEQGRMSDWYMSWWHVMSIINLKVW
jgi:hypothetical protein